MSPFREYRPVVPAATRCRRSARCAACGNGSAHFFLEFIEIVIRSWSQPEQELLRKAARAALL
jgi:hypothetical protein